MSHNARWWAIIRNPLTVLVYVLVIMYYGIYTSTSECGRECDNARAGHTQSNIVSSHAGILLSVSAVAAHHLKNLESKSAIFSLRYKLIMALINVQIMLSATSVQVCGVSVSVIVHLE